LGHGGITKGGTESLLARALHENEKDEEEADDDFDHRENADQDVHKGARIWGSGLIWQVASQVAFSFMNLKFSSISADNGVEI
jgi:hypothetical protein